MTSFSSINCDRVVSVGICASLFLSRWRQRHTAAAAAAAVCRADAAEAPGASAPSVRPSVNVRRTNSIVRFILKLGVNCICQVGAHILDHTHRERASEPTVHTARRVWADGRTTRLLYRMTVWRPLNLIDHDVRPPN